MGKLVDTKFIYGHMHRQRDRQKAQAAGFMFHIAVDENAIKKYASQHGQFSELNMKEVFNFAFWKCFGSYRIKLSNSLF